MSQRVALIPDAQSHNQAFVVLAIHVLDSLAVSSPADRNDAAPTLALNDDDWFAAYAYTAFGNVHIVSTAAWLDGLEALGVISSATIVRSRFRVA